MVVKDDEEIRMFPGQSIEIPTGCWHRIRNPGGQNLTLVEVQTGDYFGEDDIERREDDFGRVAPLVTVLPSDRLALATQDETMQRYTEPLGTK